MSNPQQPELARSRKVPHQDQDSVAAVIDGRSNLDTDAPRGPVPAENQPGHHPEKEQDKPDLEAFAQRLGIAESDERDPAPAPARQEHRPGQARLAAALSGNSRRIAAAAAAFGVLLAVLFRVRRRRNGRR